MEDTEKARHEPGIGNQHDERTAEQRQLWFFLEVEYGSP